MKRKSPRRHKVKQHIREGKNVSSFARGKGTPKIQVMKKKIKPKPFVGRGISRRVKAKGYGMVTVDKEMVPFLRELWNKGWKTSESCSSHTDDKYFSPPYIYLSPVQRNSEPKVLAEMVKYFKQNSKTWNLKNKWMLDDTGFLSLKGKESYDLKDQTRERHNSILNDFDKITKNFPERDFIIGVVGKKLKTSVEAYLGEEN